MLVKDTRTGQRRRAYGVVSMLAIASLGLSACAGSAGNGETGEEAGQADGFAYGASQEEVNDVITDLEPVTLSFQTAAPSENAPAAQPPLKFKEEVEERSNGQITIDLHWSMSVAN